MMTPREYWAGGHGLGQITPHGAERPEGAEFETALVTALGNCSSVTEFGCGIGRLAELFRAGQYLGVDICKKAIVSAQAANPRHAFRLLQNDTEPVGERGNGDAIFAHTVMLHVPDEDLDATVARFASPRVIVSEILGRRFRTKGFPPVFNREVSEYRDAFRRAGFRAIRRTDVPYDYYPDEWLSLLEFRR